MVQTHDPTRPRHPIRVAAERSGLTPTLLRAWERRYHVVEPGRSEGGQRLYSDADVERLLLLRRASEAGRAIGSVAGLSHDELESLVEEDRTAQQELERRSALARGIPPGLREAMSAVEELDPLRLEQILRREVVSLGGDRFLDELVTPVLVSIGEGWRAGRLRPSHEHVAVAVIKQVLGWMLERTHATSTARTLVVGTLPGERHELGALLAATAAGLEGWKVIFMGEDLPPEEILLTSRAVGANAVGISVVNPADRSAVWEQIHALLQGLPEGIPLFLGGNAASDLVRGVTDPRLRAMPSLAHFRAALREEGGV